MSRPYESTKPCGRLRYSVSAFFVVMLEKPGQVLSKCVNCRVIACDDGVLVAANAQVLC